mgnify:FL=1
MIELKQKPKTDDYDPIEAANSAIWDRCEDDFELYCVLFFPHYCQLPFNQFHRNCFAFYGQDTTAARVVDCAPRGYAKSVIKALLKPLHDICYGLEKYILFISATKEQAVQKLKDIRRELLVNTDLYAVYGDMLPSKKVGAEKFEANTPNGSCLLQAVGAGTEVRGIRHGESRPTKIILDDVEDSEEVLNEDLRNKNESWLQEVVSNLGSTETSIEIVGTILHRDSLLMRLKQNPAYITKIYKAVINWAERQDLWEAWKKIYVNLDNSRRAEDALQFFKANEAAMLLGSEVLWPEKEPYYELMKQLIEKGKRAFMKEKQNAPLPSNEAAFDDIWWYYEDAARGGVIIEKTGAFIPYAELQMQSFGAMDPATGGTTKSTKSKLDFTCIGSGYKDLKGRLFVHKDWTKKAKPSRYVPQIFEEHAVMRYSKFAVEENLYRGLLTENIVREKKTRQAEMKARGVENWEIKVPFYEIENRENKIKRIWTLEPKVNNGWILFNRTLSVDFMNMIEEFPNGDHDDAPDTLEMLWGMVTNLYKAKPLDIDPMGSR